MLIKMKNRISSSITVSQQLRLIGITGFGVVLFWNILGQVFFHRPEAEFFQPDWWSVWFPNYVVWSVILGAGLYLRYRDHNIDIQLI
ncbi:MAG: hypothetical protein ACC653_08685 [Gammaproteobacteria bacterium]